MALKMYPPPERKIFTRDRISFRASQVALDRRFALRGHLHSIPPTGLDHFYPFNRKNCGRKCPPLPVSGQYSLKRNRTPPRTVTFIALLGGGLTCREKLS
jgi:hypothetical protein